MSTITTINATDVVANSRAIINANFAALNADKVETLADLGITVTAAEINTPIISGIIQLWPVNSTPTGWLLCRGQAVSRTTYAALFAVLSTTYGAGDGSTTFNLPNLQGRVPVGYDVAQTEFDAMGETGGAKTHTLTTTEIPAHAHTFGSGGQAVMIGGTGTNTTSGWSATSSRNTITQTDNAGGGGAHNNLQPYIVLNYIIKT